MTTVSKTTEAGAKAQHTSGPWHLNRIGDELYIESNEGLICDMQRSDIALLEGDIPESFVELEANARMIAAAPSMAEAGQAVYKAWHAVPFDNDAMTRAVVALGYEIRKAERGI